jgi:hypothetical protein
MLNFVVSLRLCVELFAAFRCCYPLPTLASSWSLLCSIITCSILFVKVFERGVAMFKWPNVFDIWNTYLMKFIKRYVSIFLFSEMHRMGKPVCYILWLKFLVDFSGFFFQGRNKTRTYPWFVWASFGNVSCKICEG